MEENKNAKLHDSAATRGVLWAGRLAEKPGAEAFAFQSSITVDARLALDDIAGSRAHVAMLSRVGIIDAESARAIDSELEKIAQEMESGKLSINMHDAFPPEDIHSFIEGVLTERLGEAGRMVHAGRSRNDQIALDIRLYLRRVIPELCGEINAVIDALLKRADEHIESVMPGYTHLQRAQPVTLGHHLVAWCCALDRDGGRFQDALSRLAECPLGSGALATSTLPLDREVVAQTLGFSGVSINSMDSIADRDFAIETASCCAITMTHLSRFCEDVVLWASEEFGFVNLHEAWSTGSSIMPQKKNPDFAELIRGKSARGIGNMVSLLTLLKGLPYSYDRDLQEDKESLFDSIDTLHACLRMFRGMIESAAFNTERMESACIGGFLEATDAAEYLVRHGLPFRRAHEVAALLVRDCIAQGKRSLGELSIEQMNERSPLFKEDIYEALKPRACVAARDRIGGPAPIRVRDQIAQLRKRCKQKK